MTPEVVHAVNDRLAKSLERAYVQSANSGEELARSARKTVARRWMAFLQELAKKPSATAVKQRFMDCVHGATADLVKLFDAGLKRTFDESFGSIDRAVFFSLTKEQAKVMDFAEGAAEDYINQESDPIEKWPAGRKIHPLPPEPKPTREARYVGADKRKPNPSNALKIVKSGKYRERLEKWSKQITNKKAVAEEIARRVGAGESLEKIAKAIEPHVRNISSSAMRIARTEAARIHNEIAEANWNEYDSLIAGFRVLNPLDDRTRPDHRARATEKNRGQPEGRIYWKSEFAPKGAAYFVEDRPALPDAPNCRCTYTPVFRPDLDGIEVKTQKGPSKIKKVADIEGDATEEELEAYRTAKRAGAEKKMRAAVRGASAEQNAKVIGTKEYAAAAHARRAAAIEEAKAQAAAMAQANALRKQAEEQAAAAIKAEAAKTRHTDEQTWKASLSPDEKGAVQSWSRNMYGPIREYEATGKVTGWPQAEVEEKLPHLYSAIDKGVIYEGPIYRGLTSITKGEVANLSQVGSTLRFDATTSFSSSPGTAKSFAFQKPSAVRTFIVFKVVNNKTGVRVASVSAKPLESEVLVKKGAQYKVVSKRQIKGPTAKLGWEVTLEQIS